LVNSPILIVGAGITGLTAAYELHRRGVHSIVLEASSRAGGLISTEHAEGFTIEAGPDSLLAAKPAGVELIRDLGLATSLQDVRPPGGAFVLCGGRLYRLPRPSLLGIPLTWRALAGYDLLPWHARLRLALEPTVRARTSNEDESVASFFRRRFGPDTVGLIAQPLLGGIHAGDIEQLSMTSLFPRLLQIEREHGRVLGSDRGQTGVRPGPGASSPFQSLRGGMGTLVEALERALPAGTISYNSRARRIARGADGWRVDIVTEADPRTIDAHTIVLACPARVASALLAPIDRESADLCARVPYVSTASVALAFPRTAIRHPLEGTGFVVARPSTGSGQTADVRITACTWMSSKWEDRAPRDCVLLRAFIGGALDPDVVSLSDEEMTSIVRADLSRALGIDAAPVLTRVYRWRDAGAQHLVGHLDRVRRIEQRLSEAGGLFVAGSGFRSIGIPDCVADARRVAGQAAEYVGHR
jgi:oxygen-dependent protoporphyrinogen oxidase